MYWALLLLSMVIKPVGFLLCVKRMQKYEDLLTVILIMVSDEGTHTMQGRPNTALFVFYIKSKYGKCNMNFCLYDSSSRPNEF